VLAYLGGRVLGSTTVRRAAWRSAASGRTNIVAAQQALDVPADDFRMWVCLHECTHRLQFTAVPWLRGYFSGEVGRFLNGLEETDGAFKPAAGADQGRARPGQCGRSGSGPLGLMELLQSPEQRAVSIGCRCHPARGHADHVMDAVGPAVVPERGDDPPTVHRTAPGWRPA